MQPETFRDEFCDSRETFHKLEIYHKALMKWQKAINLVGPKTLQDSWSRHFADSAQLLPHIPIHVKHIVDIGSGAGFPGLVIAMMRPDIHVHLVESDDKKAQFMRHVSRESQIKNTTIHVKRIEDATELSPDVVTARALASLTQLMKYCESWAQNNPDLMCLFLKGRNLGGEIEEAEEIFSFSRETFPSLTAEDSSILRIHTLKRL